MQPTPSYPPMSTPVPAADSSHTLGGAMLLVAALLMLVGLVTKSFVSASWDEGTEAVHIGFLGSEMCDSNDGGCKSMDWDQMRGVDSDIKAVRILGLLAGFAAIGVAGFAAIMAFQKKRLPAAVLHGVSGVAAFAFTYFIIRWMGEGRGEVHPLPGWSAGLAFTGLVLASVMHATVLKPRPHAPPR